MSAASRPDLYIYGAGGHGRVLLELAHLLGLRVPAIIDDAPRASEVLGIPVLPASVFDFQLLNGASFVVGVGDNNARASLFARLLRFAPGATLVHPFSHVSASAVLGAGTVILAGAIVSAGARVGENCLLDTAVSIGHDCQLGSHVRISPGSHVAPGVVIGARCWVRSGVVFSPAIQLGDDCEVEPGAVVLSSFPANSIIPGRAAARPAQS